MAKDLDLRVILRRGAGAVPWFLPLLFLLFAFFIPLWNVLSLGLKEEGRWTLEGLRRLISDPYILHLLAFTTEQALFSTLLSFVLGFPLGWFLTRYRFPGKRALRAFTLAPFVLPPITVALGFILFFGNSGYLNRALMALFGLGEPPLKLLYNLWGIVLAHAFYNAPVFARFVNAAWEGIDPTLEEAAGVLGVGRPKAFITVTLPLISPAILSAAALVFVLCFLSFAIPLSLGGARYATVEVGVYLFARVYTDLPRAAALALLELLVTSGLTYLYVKGGGLLAAPHASVRPRETVPFLSRPLHALWLPWLSVSALLFLGPIGAVLADSLSRPLGGKPPGLGWYNLILSPVQNPFIGTSPFGAILLSLEVAALTAVLSLVLGFGVVWGLRRFRSALLEAVLMAPVGVSSVVLGLALLIAFRSAPFSGLGGVGSLVVAHTLIVYPFVTRIIRPLWDGLDPALVEAARTLGAGRLTAFLTVEVPLLSRGILVAGAFSFALSLGEMTAAAMLAKPGMVTIPLAIYRFISARRFGAASAMGVILILVTAGVVWLWEWLGEKILVGHGGARGQGT